jgi:pyruvate/2-oxoglutarate dehydrogenase complex dihydrolipoamide acyltransferase (E2) component
METFLIDVPMPSMGATVNELTVVALKVQAGDRVLKGQKLADLESDKSVFEFDSPCEGTVRAVLAAAGEVKASGTPFVRIETVDATLRHLESRGNGASPAAAAPATKVAVIWTPRALKMAQEAGLDPLKLTEVEATGPGNRVSGDDFARFLAKRP